MDRRLFSNDTMTGIKTWFDYDEETGRSYLTAEQDVTDLTDRCVNSQNEIARESKRWGEWAMVASIPLSIYAEWMASGKTEDQSFLRKWLNERDNRKFRTRLGRV